MEELKKFLHDSFFIEGGYKYFGLNVKSNKKLENLATWLVTEI